jgi:CheY-like chemotaxis protein
VDAGVDHVRVEVIDTGAGIAPDVLPHIFDAFEQGGNDVTRTFGGLGLGLAISAALADAHGGMLTAASDGLGQGARFTLELTALESLPLAPTPTEPKPAHARRLRLLLVEDHPDTSRVMTRLLRSLDHDVHAVGDVRAALRTAEVQQFDLVISDIGLPDGSGLELMRQLRERYQLKGIALSGYGMEDDMRRSREAGFDAHVTKPVDFDSLAAAIADVAALAPHSLARDIATVPPEDGTRIRVPRSVSEGMPCQLRCSSAFCCSCLPLPLQSPRHRSRISFTSSPTTWATATWAPSTRDRRFRRPP